VNTTAGVTSNAINYGPVLQPITRTYIRALGVDGDGTISFTVPGSGTLPKDAAGNELQVFTTIEVNHINDDGPPSVISITPDTTSPIGRTVGFTVIFDEAVKGFGTNDFITPTGSGFSRVNYNGSLTADSITYTFISRATVTDGASQATVVSQVNTTGITDLAGNALLGAGPLSDPVIFSADSYQLWAIDNGLSADVDFDPADDPDLDGKDNASEFFRDNDPNSSNDPLKQRAHIAQVGEANYGVITVAAPDGASYQILDFGEDGPPGLPSALIGAYSDISNSSMLDFIWSSADLQQFGENVPDMIEDDTITTPAGMPVLSPGWSYRHFRLADPVDSVPKQFFQVLTFADDEVFESFLFGGS
jgi:hypothetical protein